MMVESCVVSQARELQRGHSPTPSSDIFAFGVCCLKVLIPGEELTSIDHVTTVPAVRRLDYHTTYIH